MLYKQNFHLGSRDNLFKHKDFNNFENVPLNEAYFLIIFLQLYYHKILKFSY